MTTYVEVSDEGGVYRAAWRLTSLGEQLGDCEEPPDPNSVEWGDDEFGEHMRNEYLKAAESGLPAPDDAYQMRKDLATEYVAMGEAVQQAVQGYAVQDLANSLDFESLLFEEEENSSPSGGGGGGVAPTSDQAAPTASEEPGGQVAATAFVRSAIVYPGGDERTGSDPARRRLVQRPIFDAPVMTPVPDEASDDPVRQMLGKLRLVRRAIDPDDAREAIAAYVAASAETEAEAGEPGTDDADEPVQRKIRLARQAIDPDDAREAIAEHVAASAETETASGEPGTDDGGASHVLDRRAFVARLLPEAAGPPGEEPAEATDPPGYLHRRVMWHVDGDDGRTHQA